MKKLFAIATSILMLSCSNDNNQKLTETAKKSNLESIIVTKSTTDLLTDIFISYGASKIECIERNNRFEYKIKTSSNPHIFVDNNKLVIENAEFILEDGKLYNKSNPELFITSIDDRILINDGSVITDSAEMNYSNNDAIFLMLFLNEISTKKEIRKSLDSSLLARPCAEGNQVIVTGIGMTTGGAIAAQQAMYNDLQASGGMDGCTPLDNSPEVSTYVFIKVALVSYCCDGRGGSGGSW